MSRLFERPDRAGRSAFWTALLAGAAVLAGTGVMAAAPAGDARRGETLFGDQCALCHGGDGGQGPNLHGVVGRRAASLPGFDYSAALKKTGWTWDAAHIDAYITDPQKAVPGTLMPARVEDAGQRRDLIAYLATLKPDTPQARQAAGGPAAPPPRPAASTGEARGRTVVFGDWRMDAPGVKHRVTLADLPAPFATASAGNGPQHAARPAGAVPRARPGMKVSLWASDLSGPRELRTAPGGDVFVAETRAGRISVLRAAAGAAHAEARSTFAEGLKGPFGIGFYPAGPNPQWVYVAELNRVVRFPYRTGDLRARGPAQVIVPRLSPETGGHSTRDLAFSPDGRRMYVSIGSASNVAEEMPKKDLGEAQAYDRAHGLGATWGPEENRAAVLAFTPEGGPARLYATGIRNCVGLAVQPGRGDLWCSTNERDGLGDNLVPDYVTHVREGGYYGWPWWYLGDHEEPRLKGQRSDLRGKAIAPDVLLQPHSASLQMTFYDGAMFPELKGWALAAEHGSWNRALRTGYKLIAIPVGPNGAALGGYEDLLTGFVVDADHVWGRPVGVAVARDGAILVSEDGSNTIWRIAK